MDVPNAWGIAPLLASCACAVSGLQFGAVPAEVVHAGQLVIGWSLGSRFCAGFFRGVTRFLVAVAGYSLAALLMTTLVAGLLGALAEQSVPSLALGVAPGGIGEMSLTARLLELDVPLVTSLQLTRLLVTALLTSTVAAAPSEKRAVRALGWRERQPSEVTPGFPELADGDAREGLRGVLASTGRHPARFHPHLSSNARAPEQNRIVEAFGESRVDRPQQRVGLVHPALRWHRARQCGCRAQRNSSAPWCSAISIAWRYAVSAAAASPSSSDKRPRNESSGRPGYFSSVSCSVFSPANTNSVASSLRPALSRTSAAAAAEGAA
jgi:membrane AbrB-like protein